MKGKNMIIDKKAEIQLEKLLNERIFTTKSSYNIRT